MPVFMLTLYMQQRMSAFDVSLKMQIQLFTFFLFLELQLALQIMLHLILKYVEQAKKSFK